MLDVVGYKKLSIILPFLGFLPFLLLLLFRWANRKTDHQWVIIRTIGQFPRLLQIFTVLLAMFAVTDVATRLPLINNKIGVIEFSLENDQMRAKIANGIPHEVDSPISLSFQGGNCRIYFNNRRPEIFDEVSKILTSKHIVYKTMRYDDI